MSATSNINGYFPTAHSNRDVGHLTNIPLGGCSQRLRGLLEARKGGSLQGSSSWNISAGGLSLPVSCGTLPATASCPSHELNNVVCSLVWCAFQTALHGTSQAPAIRFTMQRIMLWAICSVRPRWWFEPLVVILRPHGKLLYNYTLVSLPLLLRSASLLSLLRSGNLAVHCVAS